MARYRGPIFHADEQPQAAAATSSNITNSYDSSALERVQQVLNDPANHTDKGRTPQDARLNTLSMQSAIFLADQPAVAREAGLTPEQKILMEAVAYERQTDQGKMMTDETAQRGGLLVVDNNMTHGGEYRRVGSTPILSIGLKNDFPTQEVPRFDISGDPDSIGRVLQHELIHEHQDVHSPMPEGLSSFDRVVWRMGQEGQAFVATEEDRRQRQNPPLPAMTEAEKRGHFAGLIDSGYGHQSLYDEHYAIQRTRRDDGRRLTMDEFQKAFGTIPGQQGGANFLEGGAYKDPADIFDVRGDGSAYHLARENAESLTLAQLPKPDAATKRFDNSDKSEIVFVTRQPGGDDAQVDVYRKRTLEGRDAYVKIDHEKLDADPSDTRNRFFYQSSIAQPNGSYYGVTVTISAKGETSVRGGSHASADSLSAATAATDPLFKEQAAGVSAAPKPAPLRP